ncbi:MAG: F0F1 ATP synthase subunit delta [Candidatus Dadabacteria bacterium]|nr:MAG: F0F1 ATP synthase subunit delta [Candidatus Dadabacteria bacterium]
MKPGSGKIARRYARALFDAAREEEKLQQLGDGLQVLCDAWKDSAELRLVMGDPRVSEEDKKAVLAALLERVGKDEELLNNFVSVLIHNRRLYAVTEIYEIYNRLFEQYKKLLSLEVTSAFELDPTEKESIENRLSEQFGALTRISWKVDREILGGLQIKCGDRLVDGSVRGSLEQLKRQLESR